MQLTSKLLGFLNRVFNKDPEQFLAFRFQYNGTGMTWKVQDGFLTTVVTGGTGGPLNIDLSQFTVLGLASFIDQQPGYDLAYVDPTAKNVLSALVLVDNSGDQNLSNGDHVYGYTSLLWSYLEANSAELELAQDQIEAMPAEMSTTTADGYWLDFIGNFYGIPRTLGEVDAVYGPRIIQTVLAPRGNNKAIEIAIKNITGQAATVTDAPISGPGFPLFNGAITFNGAQEYHSTATREYGLFDVSTGFDLINGVSPSAFIAAVTAMIDAWRDAGTHLRQFTLAGGTISDTFTATVADVIGALVVGAALSDTLPAPTESEVAAVTISTMSDTGPTPTEADTFSWSYFTKYNGLRNFNGAVPFDSGGTINESY
jgi:hypothetical protein